MRGVRTLVGIENITGWSLPVYREVILKERKKLESKANLLEGYCKGNIGNEGILYTLYLFIPHR
jgi:hypothetical protein